MDFRFTDDQKLFQQTVREFLVAQLGHDRKRVRAAALSGLGKLGDTKALATVG